MIPDMSRYSDEELCVLIRKNIAAELRRSNPAPCGPEWTGKARIEEAMETGRLSRARLEFFAASDTPMLDACSSRVTVAIVHGEGMQFLAEREKEKK